MQPQKIANAWQLSYEGCDSSIARVSDDTSQLTNYKLISPFKNKYLLSINTGANNWSAVLNKSHMTLKVIVHSS